MGSGHHAELCVFPRTSAPGTPAGRGQRGGGGSCVRSYLITEPDLFLKPVCQSPAETQLGWDTGLTVSSTHT